MQPSNACAYCDNPADTLDHVPPKCLFPRHRPSHTKLVAVPCCNSCNQGASVFDEEFRNLMSFRAAAAGSEEAREIWKGPATRSFQKMPVKFRTLMRIGRKVERYTPSGLYLGPGTEVMLRAKSHHPTVSRIVRGLHFHHFNERLSPDAPIQIIAQKPISDSWIEAMMPILRDMTLNPLLPGVFMYAFGRASDDSDSSLWVLTFYGRFVVGVFVGDADALRESLRAATD
jgi:hypothetical protein